MSLYSWINFNFYSIIHYYLLYTLVYNFLGVDLTNKQKYQGNGYLIYFSIQIQSKL